MGGDKMIRLPKRFNIFGQLVRVEYADLDESVGGLSHSHGLIQISKALEKSSVKQVLLHEFIHSVIGRISLYQTITPEIEEIICETISKAMCENFIIKNKKI